jgi:hypothetical protein
MLGLAIVHPPTPPDISLNLNQVHRTEPRSLRTNTVDEIPAHQLPTRPALAQDGGWRTTVK